MNKLYLEAPNYHNPGQINLRNGTNEKNVFLAGSITGVKENWQLKVAEKLLPHFNVFNPRRANYIWSESEERAQIGWEYHYLGLADITLFFFSFETLAPISLLELGRALENAKYTHWKKVYITIHPDYARKNDIIIQTELTNPLISKNIFSNLEEMCETIINENS